MTSFTRHLGMCRFFIWRKRVRTFTGQIIARFHQGTFASVSPFSDRDCPDKLFDLVSDNGTVSCGMLVRSITSCGILSSDTRVKSFYEQLNERESKHESDRVSRDGFKNLIKGEERLFRKALCNDLIIPDFSRFCKHLNEIYRECRTNSEGMVSSWPYVEKASNLSYGVSGSDYWGVSVCTVDGQRHDIGDVDVFCPLHSCSWPFNYAVSLKQLGPKEVHRFVGTEMVDETSILKLNPQASSPLTTSGSLIISSLLHKSYPGYEERLEKLLHDFQLMARGQQVMLKFSKEVFNKASLGSHNVKSIAHHLADSGCFPIGCKLEEIVAMHLGTSCIEADARSVALMAADLAKLGLSKDGSIVTRNTLTFMQSFSSFSRSLCLPITTSATGMLILIVNGVMGLCLWSPPLNVSGISVRSAQFCRELVRRFNLQNTDSILVSDSRIDPKIRRSFNIVGHIGQMLFSAHRGDKSSLNNLRRSGLRMDLCDYDGRTALHIATSEGHLGCVEFLVDICKVPLEPRDRWARTPLDEAVRFKRKNVQLFLEKRLAQ